MIRKYCGLLISKCLIGITIGKKIPERYFHNFLLYQEKLLMFHIGSECIFCMFLEESWNLIPHRSEFPSHSTHKHTKSVLDFKMLIYSLAVRQGGKKHRDQVPQTRSALFFTGVQRTVSFF